jgi:hypothetical protein
VLWSQWFWALFLLCYQYCLCQGFVSRCQGIGFSVKVSSIIESKSRGIGWSRFCSIKVLGCTVKIRARLLVSLHFC